MAEPVGALSEKFHAWTAGQKPLWLLAAVIAGGYMQNALTCSRRPDPPRRVLYHMENQD